jgi:hypothetical protein
MPFLQRRSAVTSAAKTTFDAALAAYPNGVGSITDATRPCCMEALRGVS